MSLRTYENVRKNWEVFVYLNQRDKEARQFIDTNPLLFHCRYLSFKDMFVELDKLVSYRSKKKGGPKTIIGLTIDAINYASISKKEKDNLKKRIFKRAVTIKKITTIRDKYYAHLDRDFKEYLGGIRITELMKVIFLLEGILIKLYGKDHFWSIINNVPTRRDFKLIEKLTD